MASEPESGLCLVCGRRGWLRCSGCRVAYHCTENHQQSDQYHLQNCSPFQIVWDDNMGYNLVASRDLGPGSFVLREAPLVIVPSFTEDYSNFCLGCSVELEKGVSPVSCPQCAWPSMCGLVTCWNEGSTHNGECSFFKEVGLDGMTIGSLKKMSNMAVQLSISVLRCIALKERKPRKWKKMMELELKYGHIISRQEHSYKEAAIDLIYHWIEKNSSNIPRDCIVKLCDMFHLLNSFRMFSNALFGHPPCGAMTLYSIASRISHSCVANASAVFKVDGKITVRAAVLILKGAKILYNYECNPLDATFQRNNALLRMLGPTRSIGCFCDRCKDPSELGSFIGGIYCQVCPDQQGILLPEIPKEEKSDMICNKCHTRRTYQLVKDSMLWSMEKDFGEICEDIDRTEAFLCKYEKIIHGHSLVMIRCKRSLLTHYFAYGINMDLQTDDILLRRFDLALGLRRLFDIVSPGINRMREMIMFHLVIVMDFRMRKRNEILDQNINSMLMEAYAILSWEKKNSAEAIGAGMLGNMLIGWWKRDSSNSITD